MTPVKPNTIWYAVQDTQILERVQILSTIIFPIYGKYVLYKLIDWPDSGNPHPLCTNEETFRLLYTPQDDTPCENQQPGNSSSKTTSQPRPFFSTVAQKLWQMVAPKNNNFW